MGLGFLILSIGIFFCFLKFKIKDIPVEENTKKITKPLNLFLLYAPLFGIVVFSVLFTTFLQGLLSQRSSHAMIVLALWMYTTAFYVELLKHYRSKLILISSVIGICVSAILAIILTPLDTYSNLLYSSLHGYTFIVGCSVLALFYAANLIGKIKPLES